MSTDGEKRDWSSDKMILLIKLYKSMPQLWNQTEICYKNKQLKSSSHMKIARVCDTSLDEVRRKIHNLRCQFNAELRKMKHKAAKQNKDVNEVKSDWKYFDHLSFLLVNHKDFQKDGDVFSFSASDNADYIDTSQTSIEFLEEEDDPQPEDVKSDDTYSKPATSRKNIITPKSEEIYLNDDNEYPRHKKRKICDDDHRIFGEYVASELRNISERGAKMLKLKIRKAILEVTEEEYNLEVNNTEYLEFD